MRAQSDDETFSIVQRVSGEQGFPYCRYRIRMPIPFSRRRVIQYDNFPHPGAKASTSREVHDRWSEPSREVRSSFWEDESVEAITASRGLRIDWTKSIYHSRGTTGVLSVARKRSARNTGILESQYRTLDLVLSLAHQRLTELLFRQLIPERFAELSARELEVIRWTSDGKTSVEIAIILGISVPTINFHIKNIVEKLHCVNRTHATAKVVALGFFE